MTLEATQSLYARTLKEQVAIRRYTGTGQNRPFMDYPARARVTGDQPATLIGTQQQRDYTAIVLHQDLLDAQCPLPITTSDKLVIDGSKELAVMFPDSKTRSIEGVTVAWVLKVRG